MSSSDTYAHGTHPSADEVFTRSSLNELSDELLRDYVARVLQSLREQQPSRVPRIASFVTASVLLRLHNLVVAARMQDGRALGTLGWTKQATLARVVGCFTGITIKQSDAEYIGNAQDYFLKDYSRTMAKACKAEREARSRAKRSGRELSAHVGSRVRELEQQIYRCKFGGVPRNAVVAAVGNNLPLPIHRQSVPFRQLSSLQDAEQVNRQLLREIQELKKEHPPLREMQCNLSLLYGWSCNWVCKLHFVNYM